MTTELSGVGRFRPSVMVRMLAVLMLVGVGVTACQSAMSVEEAKKVTGSFEGRGFVPAPRTITGITATLDAQKPADPLALEGAQARAAEAPPATREPVTLRRFCWNRARAARSIGRVQQEAADLGEAACWAHEADPNLKVIDRPGSISLLPEVQILWELAQAEVMSGEGTRGIKRLKEAIPNIPSQAFGFRMSLDMRVARLALVSSDFALAAAARPW